MSSNDDMHTEAYYTLLIELPRLPSGVYQTGPLRDGKSATYLIAPRRVAKSRASLPLLLP